MNIFPNVRYASKSSHCPICDGDSDCRERADGMHRCRRTHHPVPGFRFAGDDRIGFGQFWPDDGQPTRPGAAKTPSPKPLPPPTLAPEPKPDWERLHRWARNLPGCADHVARLATQLGVTLQSLLDIGCVWMPRSSEWQSFVPTHDWRDWAACWAFPERDGQGRIIGMTRRFPNGDKRAVKGSARGLSCDLDGWADDDRPLYLVEGPSDAAAMAAMGLRAIGRPSNIGGAEHLARLLCTLPADIPIFVVGENDKHLSKIGVEVFPGLDGAVHVAQQLALRLHREIQVVLPPEGVKDVRAFLNAYLPGLNLWDLGRDLTAGFVAAKTFAAPPPVIKPTRPTTNPNEDAHKTCARNIRDLDYDLAHLPCPHCREFVLQRKSDGSPVILTTRCGRWDCPGCRVYLLKRELLSAEMHFREAGTVYSTASSAAEWQALQKRIQRSGQKDGRRNYLRVRDGEGWLVFTDAAISAPLTPESALEMLSRCLDAWHGSSRPIATSRNWSLPKDQPGSGAYRFVTECAPDLSDEVVKVIVSASGAQVKESETPKRWSVLRWRNVWKSSRWSDDDVKEFADRMSWGCLTPPHRNETCHDDDDDDG